MPTVIAYPVCRCGHRHDRHRHHEPTRCYECGGCDGYGPPDQYREHLGQIFASLQKVRDCLNLTVPEISVKLHNNNGRMRLLPYLQPGSCLDIGYTGGYWSVRINDTDDGLMYMATAMMEKVLKGI